MISSQYIVDGNSERGEDFVLRKTVLLVDGSQVLMDITKKILERAGYMVRCAAGAAGAIEQMMDFIPDLIVLSRDLPDGSGVELCSKLRERTSVPIMFTSESKDDELPALRAGASDFLKKPFDYEIFKARIGVLLNRKVGESPETSGNSSVDNVKSPDDTQDDVNLENRTTNVKKIKAASQRFMYMAAVLFIAIALILVGIFLSQRNNLNITDIPEGDVPLSQQAPITESAEPAQGR